MDDSEADLTLYYAYIEELQALDARWRASLDPHARISGLIGRTVECALSAGTKPLDLVYAVTQTIHDAVAALEAPASFVAIDTDPKLH